jgi:DNA-binding transcriptional LysR family regulator
MQITDLNVSTRQLKAFVALSELKNFTRAARQCHLSQSAFSTLIRTLETALGLRLFDRDTRKVELTAEGRLFRDGASRLLGDFRDALLDLGEHAARRRGRVAIRVASLAAGWLPSVLADFRAEHPGIELDVADALSEGCVERVRSGRADFALAAVAQAPRVADRSVLQRPFSRGLPRRSSAGAGAGNRTGRPGWQPFIHLARQLVRQHIRRRSGRPPNRVMELEQLSTVAGMVRASLGITVVPTLTLFHFVHAGLRGGRCTRQDCCGRFSWFAGTTAACRRGPGDAGIRWRESRNQCLSEQGHRATPTPK